MELRSLAGDVALLSKTAPYMVSKGWGHKECLTYPLVLSETL